MNTSPKVNLFLNEWQNRLFSSIYIYFRTWTLWHSRSAKRKTLNSPNLAWRWHIFRGRASLLRESSTEFCFFVIKRFKKCRHIEIYFNYSNYLFSDTWFPLQPRLSLSIVSPPELNFTDSGRTIEPPNNNWNPLTEQLNKICRSKSRPNLDI